MAANVIQKKRLANEVKLLENQPLHYATAYPDADNPLVWYFLIKGQKGTDYYGGEYIGKIVHSPKYPAEPPDYYMLTPSGRYNIGSKICLTNSSYHRGDWSSTWNILSILIAFYSIWLDDKEHGISHITDTPTNRKRMAKESIEYNAKNNSQIYNKFNLTHIRDSDPEPKKTETVQEAKETVQEVKETIQEVKEIVQEVLPTPPVPIQQDIQPKIEVVEEEIKPKKVTRGRKPKIIIVEEEDVNKEEKPKTKDIKVKKVKDVKDVKDNNNEEKPKSKKDIKLKKEEGVADEVKIVKKVNKSKKVVNNEN
jgi:ubiquitin-protein ligase